MPGLTAALLVRGVHPLRAAVPALALTFALMPLFGPAGTAAVQALQSTAVTGAEVCLIMLAGMLLHELLDEAGSHEQFGTWLATRVSRPEHRALLMALGVVPFVEAVMGFGVGVIVGFPLLLRMGFSPAAAGAVTLFGQLTIPWGAMGPGTLIASRLAGVSLQALGERSAALSLVSFSVCGLAALVVTCGWKAALRSLPALAVVSGSLWAGIGLMNRWVGTPPAGILGSPFAIVASLLVAAWARGAGRSGADSGQAAVAFPARALVPYGLLAGLALLARALAGPGGASPAFPLLVTCAAVPWWFKLSPRRTAAALRRTLNRWAPVAATTVAFLATGNLMRFSGMARALAGAAASLG
ncbi:MAG TPA: L-lactate permease, partial [Limnochordales bacterium]